MQLYLDKIKIIYYIYCRNNLQKQIKKTKKIVC